MKSIRLLVLVVVAFGFTSPAPIKLAYTFKPGETYLLSQISTTQIKQSIMGMDQQMDNGSSAEMAFKVLELTGNGAKVQVSFTKLKNTVKSPQMNTEMDSEGAADTKENKLFKGLVNKPFSIWMTRLGKIEKLEGVDTLLSAFREAGIDESSAAGLKTTLQNYLGEEGLKSMIERTFITYSQTAVKKGDTWKNVQTVTVPFAITTDDTWSVAEVSDGAVKLTAEGTFVSDKEKTMSLPQGMKARVDLAGTQMMKSSVNSKTGWPTSSDGTSDVKGKMILLAGGPIPEDMEMPMEIHTETKSTITKK